jgi:hypothetical protein
MEFPLNLSRDAAQPFDLLDGFDVLLAGSPLL